MAAILEAAALAAGDGGEALTDGGEELEEDAAACAECGLNNVLFTLRDEDCGVGDISFSSGTTDMSTEEEKWKTAAACAAEPAAAADD